jgi:gas vesicle protein
MPRVHHVKKARKSYANDGIEAGQQYWWWQFAFGPKIRSKVPPKRSQLTRSSFLSNLWDLQDGLMNRFTDIDAIEDDKQELIDELQQMLDECQDSLDNMPEALQESSASGETLRERIDNLEMWINDLEGIDTDVDEDLKGEEREEAYQDIINQITETDQYF